MTETPTTTTPAAPPAPGLGALARGVMGVALAWAALVATPVSPLALDGAELALHVGGVDSALSQLDRIGQLHPHVITRAEARRRAAALALEELNNPDLARHQLEQLLSDNGRGLVAAEAWHQLSVLQRDVFGEGSDAAWSAQQAFRAAPHAAQARKRLIGAAQAHTEAGHAKVANKLWSRLSHRYPEERARSLVGQAQLALASDNAQDALRLYEAAIPHANDADLRQAARLGAATCLERLGNLDEALAEIDAAYLPGNVAERRRQGMEGRRAELGAL